MRLIRRSYPHIPNTFLFFLVLGTSTTSLPHVQSSQTETSSSPHNAHMNMSKQELQRIFQVEHHDDVPRYEVIKIHSVIRRRRRSSDDDDFDEIVHRVNLRTHGQDFNLELQRNQHLLKRSLNGSNFWFADTSLNDGGIRDANITYSPHFGNEDEEEIGFPYQDPKNRAAVLLFKDKTENAFLMDGMISEDLVVKPITPDLRDRLSIPRRPRFLSFPGEEEVGEYPSSKVISSNRLLHDDYAFLDEDEDIEDEDVMVQRKKRSSEDDIRFNSGYHIVFKRKNVGENHSSDYHYMENEEQSAFAQIDEGVVKERIHSRTKRQAPYIIFPEILCIVDYDGYRLHGKDNIAIKRYVISFWNGIDLRYKLLKSPSVKISIAGIIISRGRDATPYLERNRVGRDAIDSAAALTDMGKYLFLERRLPVYDIAVAITKLDMCRKKSQYGGDCNRGTAGFAYVGGACVVNKKLEKVNSVAIVEDTGGFSGIIVAAHELGHLLGAVHDGSPPPLYLGGPGAKKCRWTDGFIMSDLRHTSKGFRWSRCSVKQFHHFLNGETATCMYNSPHSDESLPRVLPGKLLSLDAQCRKDRGTSACFKDDRVCAQLFCFDAGSGYCVSYRPAAEGSRCGDGKMCLNGKCVDEHENSVDFDSDGFVRRSGTVDYEEAPSHQSTDLRWWSTTRSTTTRKITTTTTTTTTTKRPTTTTRRTTSSEPLTFKIKSTRLPWWKRIPRNNPSPSPITSTPLPEITSTAFYIDEEEDEFSTSTTKSKTTTTTTTTSTTTILSTSTTSRSRRVSQRRRKNNVSKTNSKGGTKANSLLDGGDGTSGTCVDRINNIAGSMSCKAFLRSFAYQYCRHKYIKKNCCASHKIYCIGGRRGRSLISSPSSLSSTRSSTSTLTTISSSSTSSLSSNRTHESNT